MGSTTTPPKITLYTNHACPWAHRAHIALSELKLDFKTEIIDLSTPRTPEYLKINPRGLVPALDYNGTIITESGIVAQFLVDAHPSHLVKESHEGALQRARIGFFVDAFVSKVQSGWYGLLMAQGVEKEVLATKFMDNVVKELEPLLQDAAPFFGGAKRLTLAEVLTGSFLLRILSSSKYEELNLVPENFNAKLEERAPAFWKWASAVVKEDSVTNIWDEKFVAEKTAARLRAMAK